MAKGALRFLARCGIEDGRARPGSIHHSGQIIDQCAGKHCYPSLTPPNQQLAEVFYEQTPEGGEREGDALRDRGEGYTARACNALRSRMTSVGPSRRINCFLLRSLNSRVTVSREEPMR